MSCKDLVSPVDYNFIDIDGQEYLFLSLKRDQVYKRYSGKGFMCSDVEDFVCILAEKYWNKGEEVIEHINRSKAFETFSRKDKPVLNIAVYYRSISNGGAQKITAMLANLWANQKNENGSYKYNIVLITDENAVNDETEEIIDEEEFDYSLFKDNITEEYSVDQLVKREYLPPYADSKSENYRLRFQAWDRILSEHDIDVVVSGLWVEPCTFWDMLAVKGHRLHPAFILHNHNFCCVPYLSSENTALRLQRMYAMCDGVVVLSETDRRFVEHFARRVKYIPNPISYGEDSPLSSYEKDVILWVGRISGEKRPLDIVNAFARVLESHPDARLYMVGAASRPLVKRTIESIKQLGIEDNVILTGFQLDVERYYSIASVFVSTSKYEGFPTTSAEAFSFGLPIVEYEMPWLAFSEDNRGIITVRQNDIETLASEISGLLDDTERIKEIGLSGKEKIREFIRYDVAGDWNELFRDVVENKAEAPVSDIALQYLTEYQQSVKESMTSRYNTRYNNLQKRERKLQDTAKRAKLDRQEFKVRIKELKREQNERVKQLKEERNEYKQKASMAQKELNNIKKSKSFRIGKLITAPVRRLKNNKD